MPEQKCAILELKVLYIVFLNQIYIEYKIAK